MYLNRLIVFLAFLVSTPAFAQKFRQLEVQEYQKYWETGPLVTADFKGAETAQNSSASHLSYKLGYFPEKIKRPDTTIYRFAAYSYVDRNNSWLSAQEKNGQNLPYYQALFNLVELYERRLQTELFHLEEQEDADKVTAEFFGKLNQEVASWEARTRTGQDEAVTKQFLTETNNQLAAMPAREMPSFSDSKISYGFQGGFGYSIISGDLSHYFQSPINATLGAEAGYKKLQLQLNTTYGFSEVRNAFIAERTWPDDIRVRVSSLEASLGYQLINSGKFNVIPFAGWSFIKFEGSDRTEVYKYHELTQHTYNAGICFDYKIRHRLNFVPGYFRKAEAAETRIRTRLSFSPVNLNDQLQGNLISLSATLNFGGRTLKVD